MKTVTTTLDKLQYFYPYTVALVGAKTAERTNFMACAWHTALSFDPPLFGVLVAKKRLTHQVITQAREFSVNFLPWDDIQLSAQSHRLLDVNGSLADFPEWMSAVVACGMRAGMPEVG